MQSMKAPMTGLSYTHRRPVKNSPSGTEDWSPLKKNLYLLKTLGAVMKFCWVESNGLVDLLFSTPFPDVEAPVSIYDAKSRKLQWVVTNSKQHEEVGKIEIFMDTQALIEPLAKVYHAYDQKLHHLARLYHQTYCEYRDTIEELEKLDPHTIYKSVAEIPYSVFPEMMGLLARYVLQYNKTGVEPSTSNANGVRAMLQQKADDLLISAFKDKYLVATYYPGSELNEMLKATCYLQEIINNVYLKYSEKDVFDGTHFDFRARWAKHISITSSVVIDPRDGGNLQIVLQHDNSLPQLRDAGILQKIIDSEKLSLNCIQIPPSHLSATGEMRSDTEGIKLFISYFKNNFMEVEKVFRILMARSPEKTLTNPEINWLVNNDFAVSYLNVTAVEEAVRVAQQNASQIATLLDDICLDAGKLPDIGQNKKRLLKQIFNLDCTTEAILTLSKTKTRSKLTKNYFHVDKLSEQYAALTTEVDRLLFLSNIYISTAIFVQRVQMPSKPIRDIVDYNFIRNKVFQIVAQPSHQQNSYLGVTNNLVARELSRLTGSGANLTQRPRNIPSRPVPMVADPVVDAELPKLVESHRQTLADIQDLTGKLEVSQELCGTLKNQLKIATYSASTGIDLVAHSAAITGLISAQEKIFIRTHELRSTHTEMKPEEDKKLSKNRKALADTKKKLDALMADHEQLLVALQEKKESFETIVPSQTIAATLAAIATMERERTLEMERQTAALNACKYHVRETLALLDTLQTAMTELQHRLKETFKADNVARLFDLRTQQKHVQLLNDRTARIVTSSVTCHNWLNTVDATQQSTIQSTTTSLKAEATELLADIEKQVTVLEYIIPRKSLRKAEELFQLAQRKKEQELARQQAIDSDRAKREKITRPKPPQKIAPLAPVRAPAAAKSEQKTSRPTAQQQPRRIPHLNQACKNLILVQKIMTVHHEELTAETQHYALLYNIFRCFQSLRMYQRFGGEQRSIHPDEVANLRNMIMHHGASSAHPEAVIEFASELRTKLPQHLLTHTPRSLRKLDLDQDQRQMLIVAFDLVEPGLHYSPFLDHSTMVLEAMPLYQKLAQFHENKTDNNDDITISHMVLKTYIPLIKQMLPPLIKATSRESDMKPEHLFEIYGFQLQALRMLASICGEFKSHLEKTLPDEKALLKFLNFCRIDVRNKMGHDEEDFLEPELFFQTLTRLISGVNATALLKELSPSVTASASSPTRAAGFFGHRTTPAVKQKPKAKPPTLHKHP